MSGTVKAYAADAATIAISGTLPGDLIVVWAFRNADNTIPTLAATYGNVYAVAGTAIALRVGSRVADGTETDCGTWTNATSVVCIVTRSASRAFGLGGQAAGTATSATMSYTGFTPASNDGTSTLIAAGSSISATDVGTLAPTGLVTRAITPAGTTAVFASSAGITAWQTQTAVVNAAVEYITYTLEIVGGMPVPTVTQIPAAVTIVQQPAVVATDGVALAQQPAVLVTDQDGNPVAGVTVSAELTSGDDQLTGTTLAVTDAKGVATFADLAIALPNHTNKLTFSVPGAVDSLETDGTAVS